METKQCHSCCEDIKPEAKQCPSCQSYQSTYYKVLKSPIGGAVIGVTAVWVFFVFLIGNRFENNSIYDPVEVLSITESTFQFKETSCGEQVAVLGKITNSGEEPLTDIVFDIEFFDVSGKLVDIVSDTEFDLIVPSGSTKSFKAIGKSGANEAHYYSHKISIAKAEPDAW